MHPRRRSRAAGARPRSAITKCELCRVPPSASWRVRADRSTSDDMRCHFGRWRCCGAPRGSTARRCSRSVQAGDRVPLTASGSEPSTVTGDQRGLPTSYYQMSARPSTDEDRGRRGGHGQSIDRRRSQQAFGDDGGRRRACDGVGDGGSPLTRLALQHCANMCPPGRSPRPAPEGSNGRGHPLGPTAAGRREPAVEMPAKLSRARLFDAGHSRKTDAHEVPTVAVVVVHTASFLHRAGRPEPCRRDAGRQCSGARHVSRPRNLRDGARRHNRPLRRAGGASSRAAHRGAAGADGQRRAPYRLVPRPGSRRVGVPHRRGGHGRSVRCELNGYGVRIS